MYSWVRASTYLSNPRDGEIVKSDESCISNPKSQISNRTEHLRVVQPVQFQICDFGFEMQDSSDFTIPPLPDYSCCCPLAEEGNVPSPNEVRERESSEIDSCVPAGDQLGRWRFRNRSGPAKRKRIDDLTSSTAPADFLRLLQRRAAGGGCLLERTSGH